MRAIKKTEWGGRLAERQALHVLHSDLRSGWEPIYTYCTINAKGGGEEGKLYAKSSVQNDLSAKYDTFTWKAGRTTET